MTATQHRGRRACASVLVAASCLDVRQEHCSRCDLHFLLLEPLEVRRSLYLRHGPRPLDGTQKKSESFSALVSQSRQMECRFEGCRPRKTIESSHDCLEIGDTVPGAGPEAVPNSMRTRRTTRAVRNSPPTGLLKGKTREDQLKGRWLDKTASHSVRPANFSKLLYRRLRTIGLDRRARDCGEEGGEVPHVGCLWGRYGDSDQLRLILCRPQRGSGCADTVRRSTGVQILIKTCSISLKGP